jgi:hypothetical protein
LKQSWPRITRITLINWRNPRNLRPKLLSFARLSPSSHNPRAQLQGIPEVKGVSVTILNDLTSTSAASSSEALEFFFPLTALRRFANAEITNQDLINQSVVLVNEVRIALDLQRVE